MGCPPAPWNKTLFGLSQISFEGGPAAVVFRNDCAVAILLKYGSKDLNGALEVVYDLPNVSLTSLARHCRRLPSRLLTGMACSCIQTYSQRLVAFHHLNPVGPSSPAAGRPPSCVKRSIRTSFISASRRGSTSQQNEVTHVRMDHDEETSEDASRRSAAGDEYELPRVMWVPDSVESQDDLLGKTKKGNFPLGRRFLVSCCEAENNTGFKMYFKPFRAHIQQSHPACCGIHRSKRLVAVER